MCFKSGNYNPNVFIWMSLGMIVFLLALHYNMVSAHSQETKPGYRINDGRLQKYSFGTIKHTGHLHDVADKAMVSTHYLSGRYSREFRNLNTTYVSTEDRKARTGKHLIPFYSFFQVLQVY